MNLSRDEFERLALEQLDTVDRMAHSLTRNRAEAEDLVQETYLRAIKAWESFDLREFGIRPWLLRILHNLHASRGARESRQPRAIDEQILQSIADPNDSGAIAWQANEALDHALDQLPVDLRTAITLWAVEDLAYKEIATVMDVPIGTVMSRLHRARQMLRGSLMEVSSKRTGIGE